MTSEPTAPAPTSPDAAPARAARPFLVLGIVLTAVFVQLLDVSIVNVAIPSIQGDLGASAAAVQLVLAGYQLAFACTLITAARLGDIHGRRRLFLLGMTTFTVASLLCGLAPDPTTLVLARILQGLGSGLMFPQVLAVIQVTFPAEQRGRAFGIFGATIGLATICGPLVGGLLLEADLFGTDWRMIFLVNVPVGLAALVLARREMPESRAPDAPRLDLLGAALVGAGLLLLVFPLTEGRERGWPAWVWVMLAASVPVLAAFVVLQVRKTRAERDPLVLMTLFRHRSFSAGVLLSSVFFLGIAPFFFAFSLYLQVGLGFEPLHSGLTTLPFAIGSGVASSRSDGLTKRLGARVLTLGATLLAVSMALLIAVLHVVGPDLVSWQVAVPLLLAGVGLGLFVAPLSNLVLAGVSGRETGSASGVLSTVQQVGGALGVALIGVLLFGLVGDHARDAATGQASVLRAELVRAGVPAAQAEPAVDGFVDCFQRRAESPDPSRTPQGCEPRPGPGAQAFASAAATANAEDYQWAIERTLLFEVLVFGTAAVLVQRLPRTPAPGAQAPGGQAPGGQAPGGPAPGGPAPGAATERPSGAGGGAPAARRRARGSRAG